MKIEEYLIDYFPFEKSEIIDFLNEKAKQRLKINGISESDNIWTFIETNSKNIHYDIYLFGEILPDIEFYDSCKLMGWDFLFRTNDFAIFYNEDKVPPLPLIDKSMDKDLENSLYDKVISDIRKDFRKCILLDIVYFLVLFLIFFFLREDTLYDILLLSIECGLLFLLLSTGYYIVLSDLKKRRKIKLRPVIFQILYYFIYQPVSDILFLYFFLDIPISFLNIAIFPFLILNIILMLYLRKRPHSPLLQKLYKHNFFISTAIILLVLGISFFIYSII